VIWTSFRRFLFLTVAALFSLATVAVGQPAPRVIVIPIAGTIDMGLAPFVKRALAEAEETKADALILDINTFGGRVDAAVVIRDALLASPVRTIAFVNRRAISAGALISLAAKEIVMTEGATIGAATPVQMSPTGGEASPVEEKTVSYVRKEFRATAESRGRPLAIAEAMVDRDVEIPGLNPKGKLLTLTTNEALARQVADRQANTLDSLLMGSGLGSAEIVRLSPNWGEGFVRLLTHPVVASLLLSIATLGIIIELRTPGFGVPGGLGILSLILVLAGHYTVELVGWEELILVGLGLTLITLEVFVIPGFGIAGIAGIISTLAGFSLSLIGHGSTLAAFFWAMGRVSLAMIVALIGSLVAFRFIRHTPFSRQLVLDAALPQGMGDAPPAPVVAPTTHVGQHGETATPLRPAGIALIDGVRVDVVSEGEMIAAGVPIVVTRMEGNRIVVRTVVGPLT
jgi:membrane-bound serine protease (ClpP class)